MNVCLNHNWTNPSVAIARSTVLGLRLMSFFSYLVMEPVPCHFNYVDRTRRERTTHHGWPALLAGGAATRPRHRLTLEHCESRIAPATSSLVSGVLTIDFTATGATSEFGFVTISGTALSAQGGSYPVANVNKIVVNDIGGSSNQQIEFGSATESTTLTLSGGLLCTGVESVVFQTRIAATGNSDISVTAPKRIDVGPFGETKIRSLSTESGSITLKANTQASATTGSFDGIMINNGKITSVSGAVTLAGRSGTVGPGYIGVAVIAQGGGGLISGSSVSINGTGGASPDGLAIGAWISGTVTTSGGPTSIVGQGGQGGSSPGSNYGVFVLPTGNVSAGGTGTVTVHGTGANGPGTSNFGVLVRGTITSAGGPVTVTGIGGGSVSEGIRLENTGTIASGSSANLSLVADSVNVANTATIRAGTVGNTTATIAPVTAGTKIDIGKADVMSGSPLTLGLTNAELNRVFAGTVIIGSDSSPSYPGVATGPITVSSAITHSNDANISVVTSKNILFNASANWTSTSGNLLLRANQQTPASSGNFVGIDVINATIGSTSGSITLQGRGGDGTGGAQDGVVIEGGAVVGAGTSGPVSINGAGGASTATTNGNWGVFVTGTNSAITSNGGSVLVLGQGGGKDASSVSTSTYNVGVGIDNSGKITAGGVGSVTVQGTGGATRGGLNYGVQVGWVNGGLITSSGGDVVVIGAAGGTSSVFDVQPRNDGIYVYGTGVISAGGTGAVTIQGAGSPNSADDTEGIRLVFGGSVTSSGGPITLSGTPGAKTVLAAISLLGPVIAGGNGAITINGTVGQSQGTIQTAGVLTVNSTAAFFGSTGNKAAQLFIPVGGKTTVNGSFDSTGFVQVDGTLGGTGSVGVTTLSSTGRIKPGSGGPGKLTTGNIVFNSGSVFDVQLNGASYSQLAVNGTVNLGGATLQATASGPNVGLPYRIIDNLGGGDITGTFAGYAEGDPLVVGTNHFIVSYKGGTGNDVTLTPPSVVSSVVFGDGTSQRSLVKQLVVNFSQPVNFSADAFTLSRNGGGDVSLTLIPTSGPVSSVTMTFSGSLTEYDSLVDGFYNLTIDASKVTTSAGSLDGDANGNYGGNYAVTGSTANKFFRFFGDSDGSGTVDFMTDFMAFRNAFASGGPDATFDFDGNGTVDFLFDFIRFRNHYNLSP